MRVSVDLDECLGYANCVVDAPDVFEIVGDALQVTLLQENPPEEFRAAVEAAALDCPAKAITVAD
jgi:ferredoxin